MTRWSRTSRTFGARKVDRTPDPREGAPGPRGLPRGRNEPYPGDHNRSQDSHDDHIDEDDDAVDPPTDGRRSLGWVAKPLPDAKVIVIGQDDLACGDLGRLARDRCLRLRPSLHLCRGDESEAEESRDSGLAITSHRCCLPVKVTEAKPHLTT